MTMKTVAVRAKSGATAEDLYIEDVPVPDTLREGQALVKVEYFGLNRMDILQRMGLYPLPPGAPTTMGVEFSGVVEKIGPGEKAGGHVKVGDKVIGLVVGGAYAEYVVAPVATMTVVGDKLSLRDGAGVPEVWFTALQCLSLVANLQPGENVLIHAGASGVGIAAIQIAQVLGANKIFATVGSDEKVKFIESELKLQGKSTIKAINYHSEDFSKIIDSGSVNVIMDPVGQSYFNKNLALLAIGGRLVQFSVMSGPVVKEPVNIAQFIVKGISVLGTNLRGRSLEYQGKLRSEFERLLLPKIISGELKTFVEKEFSIEDIAEAHKLLESNTSKGKIIVHV